MFEQRSNVVLNLFKLVKLQGWVDDRKHVAGRGLFVDEDPLAVPAGM